MPIQPFHEVLKDARFQALPVEDRLKATDAYWNQVAAENPQSTSYAKEQADLSKKLIGVRTEQATADPISRQRLDLYDDALSSRLALTDAFHTGKIKTPDEYNRIAQREQARLTEKKKALEPLFNTQRDNATAAVKRAAIADFIGGGGAKSLAGKDVGAIEGFKDTLNNWGSLSSGVAEALHAGGGDIDKAIAWTTERDKQSRAIASSIASEGSYTPGSWGNYGGAVVAMQEAGDGGKYGAPAIAKLEELRAAMEKSGIPPEERANVIKDTAASTAWTADSKDAIRKLSTGELGINPANVFGEKEKLITEINSSDTSAENKQLALAKLEHMRSSMSGKLFTSNVYADNDFHKFADAKMKAGEQDKAQILDEWSKQQENRSWIFKAPDAVFEGIKAGELGLAETVVGTGAGIASLWGGGQGAAQLQQDIGSAAQRTATAAETRGLKGGYGITTDLMSTIVQMAPMFAGGAAVQAMSGLAKFVTGVLAVYGWSLAQGYESKLSDAVDMAQAKVNRPLTPDELVGVLGSKDAQLAAFANGIQTAVLSKLLPGGSERAALGKGLASEVKAMTVRDFLTKGGREALKDSTLKKELLATAKTIFSDVKDEALEEGINQALDKGISIGMLGETMKMGDLLVESLKAAGLGGLAGGGLPQVRKGARPTHTQTLDELESRANDIAIETLAPERPVAPPLEKMTQEEFTAATKERESELIHKLSLTEDEKLELQNIQTLPPEKLAEIHDVEIVAPFETSDIPVTENNTSDPAKVPADTNNQPTNTNGQESQEGNQEGQQDGQVLDAAPPKETSPAPVGEVITTETGAQHTTRTTSNGTVVKRWTRTQGGRSVGDKYNAGLPEQVISHTDESSEGVPEEYKTTEITNILNGDKNEVETRTRDMTPDEMQEAKTKLEERNQVARDTGVPEVPIPDIPKENNENATNQGNIQEGNLSEHPQGNETRQAAEASDSNSPVVSGQEQVQAGQEAPVTPQFTPGQSVEITFEDGTTEPGKVTSTEANGEYTVVAANGYVMTKAAKDLSPIPTPTPTPQKLTPQQIKEAAPQLSDEEADVAAQLFGIVAGDLTPELVLEKPSAPKATPKQEQLELFQNPEAEGDPAATAYIQSFKGSPPKGATRALIDYAGEPLLRGGALGDLPAHTVKDIQDADQAIQQATGKNGKARLGRIGMNTFLSKIWKRQHRGKSPGWHNLQSRRDIRELGKVLSFEVAHALTKDKSGVDWYLSKISSMYETLATDYPELGNDGEERFLFSVMLAVTSNGQTVYDNLSDTLDLYDRIRGTHELPLNARTSRSERGKAVQNAFREINALLKEKSWQEVKADLLTPITVSDLKKKYGREITGEHSSHTVLEAMILGPKIGSFWGNLNGHFDSITMDLWFTRTMNRLSGDTATINPDKLVKEFTNLLAFDLPIDVKNDIKAYLKDASDTEKSWTSVPSDIREKAEFLYDFVKSKYGEYTRSNFNDRSDFNKTVQKIVKELDGGEDTPDNGSHRAWMRDVVGAAQDQLKKAGINLTNADLQAILWFHEKDLYTRFGATTSRGERTDYARAAEKLVGSPRQNNVGPASDGGLSTGTEAGSVRQAGLLDIPTETRKQMEARLKAERDDGGVETLNQDSETTKGQITFAADMSKAWIKLNKSGDISTFSHEVAHFMRRFILNPNNAQALAAAQRRGITDSEISTLAEWAGVGKDGVWSIDAEEKFARAIEKYLREGKAPSAALQPMFDKLSEWLKGIYKTLEGTSINIEITPEVKAIFDKLFAGPQAQTTPEAKPATKPVTKPAAKKKLPPMRKSPSTTSVKNAETDRELAAAGISSVYDPGQKALQETWDESMSIVSKDPNRGTESSVGKVLVQEIFDKPRAVTDVEHGILLDELAQSKLARARAIDNLLKARKENNTAAIQSAERDLENARDAIFRVVTASKMAGTEWGRAGRFRQIRIEQDYTIEAMEAAFRSGVVKEGEPFTAADAAYVKQMQKKIEDAENLVAKLQSEIGEAAQREVALVEKLKEKAAVRGVSKEKTGDLTRRITDVAAKGRAFLLGRGLGRQTLQQKAELTLNQDEELDNDTLEALAGVGAEYIANGKKDLDAFIEALVTEFGDVVKPYAKKLFEAAQDEFRTVAKGVRSKTPSELLSDLPESGAKLSNKLIYNMARGFIHMGYDGRAVIDQVTEALQDDFPGVTREEVSNEFTGYGKVKYPSKEDDLKMLRELRNMERIQAQIDDVKAGIPAKKTGQQRDKATARLRDLQQELKEAQRAAGITHATSENQLRGALDAIKSRLENEIESLSIALSTKTKRQEKKTEIHDPEQRKEIEELRDQRDKVKADYEKFFGINRKAMTDEKRVEGLTKSLTDRIAEEESMAKAGILQRAKSGIRTPITPEIKALQDRLDALRDLRHKAQQAQKQTKTAEERAIDRAMSAVQASITRYEEIIASGKLPVNSHTPAFTPSVALEALWNQRTALREAVDELRKSQRPRLSAQEKARRQAVAQLEKSLKEVERRINTGDFSIASKKPGLAAGSPDVVALKAQLKGLRETYEALKKAQDPTTPEERKDAALVRASKTRKAKIEKRIKEKDYVKAPVVPREKTAALKQALYEESLVKAEWNKKFFEAELAKRTPTRKTIDAATDVVNLSRTMMTVADVSAVFRQGGLGFIAHPVLGMRAANAMGQQAFSEAEALAQYNALLNRPNSALAQEAKLFLSKMGPDVSLTDMEEAFRGRVAKKIPGLKSVVGFSERTYTGFLNRLRMDMFDSMIAGLSSNGQSVTAKEAKIIADYINKTTGRGNLGSAESAAAALAIAFFSLKFVVSRFQWLYGLVPTTFHVLTGHQFVPEDIRRAKKALAKEYSRTLVGISAVYTLAALAKAGFGDDKDEWEIDPRSSDFGKIKIGNTFIDPMSGLLQAATFLMRVLPTPVNGKYADVLGYLPQTKVKGQVHSLNSVGWGQTSYTGVVARFARTKLSPMVGTWLNLGDGVDMGFNKVTMQSEVIGMFMPLVVGEIYDTMQENGVAKGVPLALLSLLGVGVQNHNDNLPLEQRILVAMGSDPSKYGQKKSASAVSVFKKKSGSSNLPKKVF